MASGSHSAPLKHREYIISICSKLGIPLSERSPAYSYQWDGKTIAVNDWRLSTSDLLHEVAHWLVSCPERRVMPDFGLGTGPDSGMSADEVVADPDSEEEFASVLGILYEKALGLDWKDTFRWHGWDQSRLSNNRFLRISHQLREMELVKWGGIPTVMP